MLIMRPIRKLEKLCIVSSAIRAAEAVPYSPKGRTASNNYFVPSNSAQGVVAFVVVEGNPGRRAFHPGIPAVVMVQIQPTVYAYRSGIMRRLMYQPLEWASFLGRSNQFASR